MRKVGLVVAVSFAALLLGCGGSTKAPVGVSTMTGSVEGRLASSGTKQTIEQFVAKVHGASNLSVQVRNDGSFRIDNVPAGEQTITVEDPQTMKGAVVVAFVRPGKVTYVGEIQLTPLGKISGIVSEVDENGEPKSIPHARIVARPIGGEEDTLQDLPSRPLFVAFSDANGSYDLLLPEGIYFVEVSHPDYEPAAETASVQPLKTTPLDFVLVRRKDTGVVYGTVTAVINDQTVPVAGALVALIPEKPFAPGVGDGILPPIPEMKVGQIVSAMQKGKGKNHRPNPGVGGPNGGIIIPPIRWRPLFTFTNADGSYELTGVPEGEYTAIAFKCGLGRDQKEVSVKPNERVRVDFVLQAKFGIVKGTVTDAETGKPIEGALVVAVRWGDPWFIWDEWKAPADQPIGDRPIWVRPMPFAHQHQHKGKVYRPVPIPSPKPIIEPPVRAGTFTDAEGEYQLLLPAGEYFISVLKEGYEWQGQQVTVVGGQEVTVDFALNKFQLPPELSLSVELEVETPVQQGEAVTMTLKVRNIGDQPVTLKFTSLPEADFVVMTENYEEVWRWSHGKSFIMIVPDPVELPPGGEKAYTVEWDQKDNDGNQVPAGDYIVLGILRTSPQIETETSLQILPSNP